MSKSTPSPSVIISILLPIGILLGFWMVLNEPISEDPKSLPAEIQEIDSRLAETQPEVILVGSSLANRAIDNDAFAKRLGLQPNQVQKLWSGMAAMPAISLMIENRILNQNLQPKVVAILSPPLWLATTDVLQDANFSTHQTRPLNSLLAEVLGREADAAIVPWKQRKNDFQSGYQEWNQELFGEGLLGENADDIDTKLDALFAAEKQRQNIKRNQLIQHNVRQTEEQREQQSTDHTFELRLLESVAKRLKERDIHLVVVILPVSKRSKDAYALSDNEMLQLVDSLQRSEVSLIDLFDWDELGGFGDTKHMSARGRKAFTPLLADKWTELQLLSDQPKTAEVPVKLLKPTVTISDDTTISANGRFTLTFPNSQPTATLTACISGQSTVNRTVFSQSTSRIGSSTLWCEDINLTDIKANEPIRLQNQSDEAITVHSLRIQDIELLSTPKIILGKINSWTLERSKKAKEFSITKVDQWPKWISKKKSAFPTLQVGELSRYKGLSDVALAEKAIDLNCRPLQIKQSNQSIELSSCKEVWTNKNGYCVSTKNLIALTPDSIDLETLSVQLTPNRLCHLPKRKVPEGYWIFSGDSSSTRFNWPKGNYSRVYIEGMGIGKGEWRVEVFEGDTIFLDQTIQQPLDQELELLLDQTMLKKHTAVQVRISVPQQSYTNLFVRRIELKN